MLVPEAGAEVGSFRERYDHDAVARGIPPHVTVLFPFAPAAEMEPLDAHVRAHAATLSCFDARLDGIGSFEEHVWLRPAPPRRWRELIEETARRVPELPPYEGAFETVVPHLTVGAASRTRPTSAVLDAARRDLAPLLPLRFRVTALTLLAERLDGTWSPEARFPLA